MLIWEETDGCSYFLEFNVTKFHKLPYTRGGLISLWLYKENNKLRDWKNVFTLHIPPWAPYTYDFLVLNSSAQPKKSFGCAANKKIRKAKDLSAPLRLWHVAILPVTVSAQPKALTVYLTLGHWDTGFESHLGHGRISTFLVCRGWLLVRGALWKIHSFRL
jgi:hypothetical protein